MCTVLKEHVKLKVYTNKVSNEKADPVASKMIENEHHHNIDDALIL